MAIVIDNTPFDVLRQGVENQAYLERMQISRDLYTRNREFMLQEMQIASRNAQNLEQLAIDRMNAEANLIRSRAAADRVDANLYAKQRELDFKNRSLDEKNRGKLTVSQTPFGRSSLKYTGPYDLIPSGGVPLRMAPVGTPSWEQQDPMTEGGEEQEWTGVVGPDGSQVRPIWMGAQPPDPEKVAAGEALPMNREELLQTLGVDPLEYDTLTYQNMSNGSKLIDAMSQGGVLPPELTETAKMILALGSDPTKMIQDGGMELLKLREKFVLDYNQKLVEEELADQQKLRGMSRLYAMMDGTGLTEGQKRAIIVNYMSGKELIDYKKLESGFIADIESDTSAQGIRNRTVWSAVKALDFQTIDGLMNYKAPSPQMVARRNDIESQITDLRKIKQNYLTTVGVERDNRDAVFNEVADIDKRIAELEQAKENLPTDPAETALLTQELLRHRLSQLSHEEIVGLMKDGGMTESSMRIAAMVLTSKSKELVRAAEVRSVRKEYQNFIDEVVDNAEKLIPGFENMSAQARRVAVQNYVENYMEVNPGMITDDPDSIPDIQTLTSDVWN